MYQPGEGPNHCMCHPLQQLPASARVTVTRVQLLGDNLRKLSSLLLHQAFVTPCPTTYCFLGDSENFHCRPHSNKFAPFGWNSQLRCNCLQQQFHVLVCCPVNDTCDHFQCRLSNARARLCQGRMSSKSYSQQGSKLAVWYPRHQQALHPGDRADQLQARLRQVVGSVKPSGEVKQPRARCYCCSNSLAKVIGCLSANRTLCCSLYPTGIQQSRLRHQSHAQCSRVRVLVQVKLRAALPPYNPRQCRCAHGCTRGNLERRRIAAFGQT